MIALGITIASLAAYFSVGFLIAVRDMPKLWARARKAWYSEDTQRSSVMFGSAMTFMFWPFRWPFVALMNAADQRDPKVLEQQVRDQQSRIAELERELRIGRDR